MSEWRDDDAEFAEELAALRDAGRLEEVPRDVAAAVKAAFARRTLDAELARLVYDSVEDGALAGVRGAEGETQLLTFESPAFTVEVEASPAGPRGDRRRLIGQLVPPQPGRIEVRQGGGTAEVEVDELGRFTADDLAAGAVSLRWVRWEGGGEGGHSVVTDWFLI